MILTLKEETKAWYAFRSAITWNPPAKEMI